MLQCVQQKAKLLTLLFCIDTQYFKDRLLHFLIVDTNRTTTQLTTVENHIISTRQSFTRVGLELFFAARRRGKGVM